MERPVLIRYAQIRLSVSADSQGDILQYQIRI